jgi:hypothetical protein
VIVFVFLLLVVVLFVIIAIVWVSRRHRIADEFQPIKPAWRKVLYDVSLYNPRDRAGYRQSQLSASHRIARPRQILIAK